MPMLYVILPLALVFACGAVAAFAWTVRSGQLDDVDTPPRRILFDDASERGRGPVARGRERAEDDDRADPASHSEGFADPAREPMNPRVLDWHDS